MSPLFDTKGWKLELDGEIGDTLILMINKVVNANSLASALLEIIRVKA
jgi:hypothetical protein